MLPNVHPGILSGWDHDLSEARCETSRVYRKPLFLVENHSRATRALQSNVRDAECVPRRLHVWPAEPRDWNRRENQRAGLRQSDRGETATGGGKIQLVFGHGRSRFGLWGTNQQQRAAVGCQRGHATGVSDDTFC